MTGRIFAYHALGIDNLGASNFNLMSNTLPQDVGVWLADARQDSRVSTNMGILELGEAHGFVWSCSYGQQEVGWKGFSVRIVPKTGVKMTLSEVQALEREFLDRDCLSDRYLSVMPYCENTDIMMLMRWSLSSGFNWSHALQ